MASFARAEATLLKCAFLFLYMCGSLCQRDCTGVECPQLENCIEKVQESGACCASCLQKGCTCEGYQYYDCITAGFSNGKVPEGESYFVDYSSTECSCPVGGGNIICHYIICPEIPPNCLETVEPPDECMQCVRLGCVDDGQKYEPGYSFQMDECQFCRCPMEGGELMCYPAGNCDTDPIQEPVLGAPTETDNKGNGYPYRLYQQERMDHSTPFGSLPLFKVPPLDKEEPEDYEYGPTDFPETYPKSLLFPTQASTSNKVTSLSQGSDRSSSLQSTDRRNKLELREQYGVHGRHTDTEGVTESPLRVEQSTVWPHTHKDATPSWQSSHGVRNVQSVPGHTNPLHVLKGSDHIKFPLTQGLETEKLPVYPHRILESAVHHQRGSQSEIHHQNASDSVIPRGSVNQISVSHHVRGTDSAANQQRESDSVTFPLYMQRSPEGTVHPHGSSHAQKELHGTAAPEYEEWVDEGEKDAEEEDLVTLHRVTGPEERDVPYRIKSAQQEENHEESKSSSYEMTTLPGTSSPRRPEDLTTPTVQFIATTTHPALKFTQDEREPSRQPAEGLFDLHSEDQKEVMEEEEEKKDHPVLLVKPEGG